MVSDWSPEIRIWVEGNVEEDYTRRLRSMRDNPDNVDAVDAADDVVDAAGDAAENAAAVVGVVDRAKALMSYSLNPTWAEATMMVCSKLGKRDHSFATRNSFDDEIDAGDSEDVAASNAAGSNSGEGSYA